VASALIAADVLEISAAWPYPCTAAGTEPWHVARRAGVEADVVLCPPHGDRLRGSATSWMGALGVTLSPQATQ
jgi:hypothetical protein